MRGLAAAKEERVKRILLEGVEGLGCVDEDKREGEGTGTSQDGAALETKGDAGGVTSPQATVPSTQSVAAINYTTMPLDRLRALDKARDATLSFLLKRINKVEADLKALGDEPAAAEPP